MLRVPFVLDCLPLRLLLVLLESILQTSLLTLVLLVHKTNIVVVALVLNLQIALQPQAAYPD